MGVTVAHQSTTSNKLHFCFEKPQKSQVRPETPTLVWQWLSWIKWKRLTLSINKLGIVKLTHLKSSM